ncbi:MULTISPECIES: hypothetical protein [Nocardiopsidaceae]|uniref:Uncharacterized protein n=1 Tax=Streptomonospora nanhaiensis TaxID=1323731 RepID=A0ABY6YNK6_9ACTN|nr:hypothetical protein [Streptomonospora nanhaiensis]WAE73786.1 hypothetical protein OUQ99_01255 [Streptomonospora nanhaiensis]
MIEDFRGAVSAVAEAAENQPSQLRAAVSAVFRLADRVPADARVEGLAVLTETLRAHQWSAGVAADIALLCGALVESGVPAGPAGVEVMRQLAEYGKLAGVFLHVWQKTGDDAPPHPSEVGEASEERVTPELEQLAPLATTGWWVSHRYGLAAKTMLCDPGVRAALREDPRTLGELVVIAGQLGPHVEEYGEIAELLRMAEADRMVVLHRQSARVFRVRFDGVSDNFQLHTLLEDALIGDQGLAVPGRRPLPEWVASATDLRDDPRTSIVEGQWDLVGVGGTWVDREAAPGAVPVVDGERAVVLEPISLPHSWRTGRRHPHIDGWLRVEEELSPEEGAQWWKRAHPPGGVVHPMLPAPPPAPEPGPGAPPAPAEPWGVPQAYRHDFVPPPLPDHGGSDRAPGTGSPDTAAPARVARHSRDDGRGEAAPADERTVPAPHGSWGEPPTDSGGAPGHGAPGAASGHRAGAPEPWDAPVPSETWDAPADERTVPAPHGSWGDPRGPGEDFAGEPPESVPPPPPGAGPGDRSARPVPAHAATTPPGAVHMDPLPEGVSDSSGWGPSWKD